MSAQTRVTQSAVSLLGEMVRPWRGQLAGALACVLVAAAVDLVPPLIMGRLVDDYLRAGVAEGLLALAILYLGALVAVQLLRMVKIGRGQV